MPKDTKITFIASLPPIQSAMSLDGMGDGCRLKLDISRQHVAEVMKLQLLAGQTFKVTIEPTGDYYEGS